jgi:hypothetical protein
MKLVPLPHRFISFAGHLSPSTKRQALLAQMSVVKVRLGSWSYENALADALTLRSVGDLAEMVILLSLAAFPVWIAPDQDSSDLRWVLRQQSVHACNGYAFIATMSGWMPMMFMTRVRLDI